MTTPATDNSEVTPLSAERIARIRENRICDVSEINAICDMAIGYTQQAAEMAELKAALDGVIEENTECHSVYGDYQLAQDALAGVPIAPAVGSLAESVMTLRQSTLSPGDRTELIYLLTRYRDDAIEDGLEATEQRVNSAINHIQKVGTP